MKIINVTCPGCNGKGFMTIWHEVQTKRDEDGMFIARTEMCSECKGEGNVPRPEFTVEEAIAILEHCGLIGNKGERN